MENAFWNALDTLAAESEMVIDRPGGTAHPRYPDMVYPLDYGYLAGTSSMDGGGIDVWRGSLPGGPVTGIICTVDLLKRDSEIKILLACSPDEMRTILDFQNNSGYMKAILIERETTLQQPDEAL